MVTQVVPRVDLDVAAGEKDQESATRSAPVEDAAPKLEDGRLDADRLTLARHDWFAHLHAHEYEPPLSR